MIARDPNRRNPSRMFDEHRKAIRVLMFVLAGTGLSFFLQDTLLSDTLRSRLLGPRAAAALANVSGAACVLLAVALIGCLGVVRWLLRRRGAARQEAASSLWLWPFALLNLLMLGDPAALLGYAHVYAGLGALGLSLWAIFAEGRAAEPAPLTGGEQRGEGRGTRPGTGDSQLTGNLDAPASGPSLGPRPSGLAPSSGLRQVPAAVYAAMAVYIAVFASMAILQFHSLNLQPVDCYAAEQRMWNALHGTFLRSDNTPYSFLAEHVQVFDLLLLPIYAICPRLETLLVLHIAVAAVSSLPVWLFAAEVMRSRGLATAFALAFLLHPGLHFANLEASGAAYNPVLYCVPFLAWGLLFLHRGQYGRWAICAALAILVKEEIALLVLAQGVYIAVWKGKGRIGVRRLGLAAAAVSLAWFGLSVWVVIPHFAGHQTHVLAMYAGLGKSSREILGRIASEPWLVPERLFTRQNAEFLVQLFLPYGWLGLLDPLCLLLALPTYAYLMLSDATFEQTHSILFYYHIPLLPFVAMGSIRGLRRLIDWLARHPRLLRLPARAVGPAASAYLMAVALGATVILSKTPISLLFYDPSLPMVYYGSMYVIPPRARIVSEIQRLIPRDAVVSTSDHLTLFFTHWRHCYPNVPAHALPIDYMVFDLQDKWRRLFRPSSPPPFEPCLASGQFEKIFDKDGFVVLRRK